MENITEEQIKKILNTVDHGLSQGLGDPEPGKMCVEAAVCYGLGLPHSDYPHCVGHTVREFKIKLNDKCWSNNKVRAQGMRKLAIAQLGSNQIDQTEFCKTVAIETVKRLMPDLLFGLNLNDQAKQCLAITSIKEMISAMHSAEKAMNDLFDKGGIPKGYPKYLVGSAICYCKITATLFCDNDTMRTISRIIEGIEYIENTNRAILHSKSELPSECAKSESSLTYAERYDKMLNICAQIGLDALVRLNSPGCKYLYLCE